ncbi:MAG: LTA synthase family protein [Eubacteriales bacterium]|nr:LTA synthase family protein [Eubacteriales bacterium]
MFSKGGAAAVARNESFHDRAAAFRPNGTIVWLAVVLFGVALNCVMLAFAHGSEPMQTLEGFWARPAVFTLNLLPILLWTALLYCALNRLWLAGLLGALPVLLLTWVNYYKLALRNDPLLFEDLLLFEEAANMSRRYAFTLCGPLLAGTLLALAPCALFFCVRRHLPSLARGARAGGALCSAAALLGCMLWLYPSASLYSRTGVSGEWAPTQTFTDHGVLYPFLHSVSSVRPSEPDGYDQQETEALLSKYSAVPLTQAQKPHVISIMLEAFADFTGLCDFDRDPYADLHALMNESALSGTLITSIFAGGTVDTERCFLTGCLKVPQLRRDTQSYARYFLSQGYRTSGNHPWYKWFYNRENANRWLGFESYDFLEDRFAERLGSADAVFHTDDQTLFEAIFADYRANLASGQPLFSFSVSYQNHGPYSSDPAPGEAWLKSKPGYTPEGAAIAEHYFTGIADTCAQFRQLTERLDAEAEPIALIAFGDHRPWLGDKNSVYAMLGINLDVETQEGFRNYYSTPWLIWLNQAARQSLGVSQPQDGGLLGPYYLLPRYFQLIGAKGDAFNQCLTDLMEQTRYVNCIAYERGGLAAPRETGNEPEAVRTLEALQYQRLSQPVSE